jgi:hypothetical protein
LIARGLSIPPDHLAYRPYVPAACSPDFVCQVMAGAISLFLSAGGGLYWFVPAVILGFIGSVANAWVLLIEILR